MKLLLDTHILIWSAADILPISAVEYVRNTDNTLLFSPINIWEVAIKHGLKRYDFYTDPQNFYNGLLANGYFELSVTSQHALAIGSLPALHKDPFDRILLAQSVSEGIPLLTFDRTLAQYPAPVILLQK